MKLRKLPALLLLLVLLAFLFPSVSQGDTPEPPPTTVQFCSESQEIYGTIPITKARRCMKAQEFPSVWHLSDTKKDLGIDQIGLVACTSKNSNLKYFSVKKECRNYQNSNYYYRTSHSVLLKPIILEATNISRTTVDLNVQIPDLNQDAPIKHFEVTAISSSASTKQIIESYNLQAIVVEGLSPETNYKFTIKAFSIDGASPESLESLEVKTLPPAPVNLIPVGPTALTLQIFFLLTLMWLGFVYLRRRFSSLVP